MKIIVALILILLAPLACGYVSTELKLVSVLYNHGDRMPAEFYPADLHKNESLWPEPLGHLTNRGKEQHFKLGKYLRLQYTNFLSKFYDPEEVLVQSTDVDLTLMSAEATLAGLFPPVRKICGIHICHCSLYRCTPGRKNLMKCWQCQDHAHDTMQK